MSLEKSLVGIAESIITIAEEMGVESIYFYEKDMVMCVRNLASLERFARTYGVPLEEEYEGSVFFKVQCHPVPGVTVRCFESMHDINEIEDEIAAFNEELEEL